MDVTMDIGLPAFQSGRVLKSPKTSLKVLRFNSFAEFITPQNPALIVIFYEYYNLKDMYFTKYKRCV
jgi:hypothetical protein